MQKNIARVLLAFSALWMACQPEPGVPVESSSVAATQDSTSSMDFELASLDGGTMGPGDAGADLILVDFWATWCGPCHLQADILAKLYPELKSRGVEFLAVSLGEPESIVREFVSKRPFPYTVLVDPTDSVASKYSLYILPTVVLLDRDGVVMYLHEGISTASRLRFAVDEIIEGRSARRAGSKGSDKRRLAS